MINIIKDPSFLRGFSILKRSLLEDNDHNLLSLPYGNLESPSYRLAEYFTNVSLYDHHEVIVKNGEYWIRNERKEIYKDKQNRLTLSIFAEKEYEHARKEGEAWPHLLIEQRFQKESVFKMRHLLVDLDTDFLSLESFMNEERNELHTLQVSLYFAVGDENPSSPGFKDFYWFGLPLIDAPRYPFPKSYCSRDIGKEDATRKLIYSIDPHLYMQKSFGVGDHLSFTYDCASSIKEGFFRAKELGYLPNSKWEDMTLFSFNLGFEVTGTFNGKIRINHFNIWKESEHE